MKNIQFKLIVLFLLFLTHNFFGQNSIKEITKIHLQKNVHKYNLNINDVDDIEITSSHISKQSKINHIYGTQRFNGIEIYNSNFDIHLINGNSVIKSTINNFVSDLTQKALNVNTIPELSAKNVIPYIANQLNLTINKPLIVLKSPEGVKQKQLISSGGISYHNIHAKLMYFYSNDVLKLVWDISFEEINSSNWWSLKVDSRTGQILDQYNWTVTCNLSNETFSHANQDFSTNKTKGKKYIEKKYILGKKGYRVFEMPIETPNHGVRTLAINPENATASPFGWHDTNGVAGAEFTNTRGNNVYAYEDRNADNDPGFSPNNSNLRFDFPLDINYTQSNNSEAAAITNLFYWNNIIHDVTYQYGFDEDAGNFQENNYVDDEENSQFGVGIAGDFVYAEAQDGGGTCNANFGTPPDGQNPRMQMFICSRNGFNRDGDLDNLVIIHEYGHGISNRLVGGPSNSTALRNIEQMGEGWSDWFGLMLTMDSNSINTDSRGIGTWLFGENSNGSGIRSFPYSTDISISEYTYDDIKTLVVPHGVGSVWASMLWEMTWELINEHGFDDDFYSGTGGNNIALQLVVEGLKLTPASPGFVDARNAILQADQILYNSANECLIWSAFAKRGLGFSATQGSSNSRSDGSESFDLPDSCNCQANVIITENVNFGQVDIQESSNTITVSNIVFNGAIAEYDARNTVFLKPNFIAKSGSIFRAYIDGCIPTIINQNIKKTIDVDNVENNIVDKSNYIKAYPNPAKNELIIESTQNILNWELISVYGKSYFKGNEIKRSLNINRLPDGIYFLKAILKDGSTITKKIIKN